MVIAFGNKIEYSFAFELEVLSHNRGGIERFNRHFAPSTSSVRFRTLDPIIKVSFALRPFYAYDFAFYGLFSSSIQVSKNNLEILLHDIVLRQYLDRKVQKIRLFKQTANFKAGPLWLITFLEN